MKKKFTIDALHLHEVISELEGTPAAQFAYPATLYAVSKFAQSGSRRVLEMAVSIAQEMARAEI